MALEAASAVFALRGFRSAEGKRRKRAPPQGSIEFHWRMIAMTELPISSDRVASDSDRRVAQRVTGYYDPAAVPEPQGVWDYELNDAGVIYGSGAWPFWRERVDVVQFAGKRVFRRTHRLMNLVPNLDDRFQRRTHYVTVLLGPGNTTALVTLEVFVRAEGAGGIVERVDARLVLEPLRWEWIKEPHAAIYAAAQVKRDKVLAFMRHAIEERDHGARSPSTARQRQLLCRAQGSH
jgi:hypothetical protein